MGITRYEFGIMDYIVVVVAGGFLIAMIIVACICFPPYKSEEEWEKIEDARDKRDAEAKAKREKENMEAMGMDWFKS